MPFARSQLPAARAYVDSVFAAGGARTGRGTRHPSTWSSDYTLRVANVWQRQTAAGRPLSLQEARRGPVYTARVRGEQLEAAGRGRLLRGGLEHPRQRFVGPTDQRGRPELDESVGFFARQYRQEWSARRWIENLSSERVQVIAYGVGLTGASKFVSDDVPGWRVLFTGPRETAAAGWDSLADGWHLGADGGRDAALFDTIERWEIRWGPGIGD